MRLLSRVVLIASLFLINSVSFAGSGLYGAQLCREDSELTCYRVHSGDTWNSLFPDAREQDLVKRINRMGTRLYSGIILAVPKDLDKDAMDFSPFSHQISPPGERIIMVSTDKEAWAAYDSNGTLVRWGPASSARGYCPDQGRSCHTVMGRFEIYSKEGEGCYSHKFPVGRGGAPMPYCMFFHGGFAIHGSYEVPGYNASHGCVRVFVGDAEWLNHDFSDVGTPVIVSH